MTASELKAKITVEDVIKICCELQGTDEYLYDNEGHPIFSTFLCHGGDSWKLYYYPETGLFHCFTCSSSYDIIELVCRAKQCDFVKAVNFIKNFLKIKDNSSFDSEKPELTDDWSIFQQVDDFEKTKEVDTSIEGVQENIIDYFYPLAAPVEWIKEGISPEVMRYYNIRVDSALHKIVIPHVDVDGKLIGLRGRSYNPFEVAEGKKYMPIFIEGDMYNHPLGKNLFGLYQNKETIKRLKKVLICESEKAVMQAASFYGVDNCFVVATCGSNLTQAQIQLIMDLGVQEVMIGYDKEYHGKIGEQEELEYEKKLLKLVRPLSQYFNTYLILDNDDLLGYKDSPTDKGKEVLEKLMKKKIYIPTMTEEYKKAGKHRGN